MIKKLNPVLKGMIIGILICGIVFQAAFMWLADSYLLFTTGLWIGIFISVFMALHMNYAIESALDRDEEDAVKYMRKMYALRLLVVLILFFAVFYFRLGNVIAVFMGLFSLKIGAYLAPVINRVSGKIKKEKGR